MLRHIENGIRLPQQCVRLAVPAQLPAHICEPGKYLDGLGVPVAEYLPAVGDRGPVGPLGGREPSLPPVHIGKAYMESASRKRGSVRVLRAKGLEAQLFRRLITALAAVKIDEAHGDNRRIYPGGLWLLFRGRDGGAIMGLGPANIAESARGDGRSVQMDGIVGFYRRAAAKCEGRTTEIALPERPATFRQ